MFYGLIIALMVVAYIFMNVVKIIPEYERAVVFRLGRVLHEAKGPGLIILIPFVDRMVKIPIRVITMDIDPQDVISKDNISLKVNAVLYFRVLDATKAIINVENYLYATSQLAQTQLRSSLGAHTMDEILSEREKINNKLQETLDQNTEAWGLKVTSVEIKQIDLPVEMQRAMARQAEAERERRAKVISAEGEKQAATMLTEAAVMMSTNPVTLQLRYLQTLADIATEQNTKIIFPIPLDIFGPLQKILEKHANKI